MDIVEWLIHSKMARFISGLILVGVSTVIWMSGYFWPWGWVVGVILLLAAIPERGKRDTGF